MRRENVVRCLKALGVKVGNPHAGWIEGSCPFAPWTHRRGAADRDATFSCEAVSPNRFTCLQCKQRGNILALPAMLAGYAHPDLKQRYRDLAARFNEVEEVDMLTFEAEPEEPPQPLFAEAWDGIFGAVADYPEALAYVEGRGVGQGTVERLNLLYDSKLRRIVFPVFDRAGELWGFTGRAIDPGVKAKVKNYQFVKSWHILGCDLWQPGKPVLLVEGQFGLAHLHEIGAAEHVNLGCLMGSRLSRHQAQVLATFGAPVILLFDDDEAGETGLREALPLLDSLPVSAPAWPEGKADPDQLTEEDVKFLLTCPFISRETPLSTLDADMNAF